LSSFNLGSSITLGGFRWARAHWQDQTLFYDGLISPQDINTVLYANGSPASDISLLIPRSVMFNYNEPYTGAWLDSSSGPIPITLTPIGIGIGISSPTRDNTTYVA
jgi:hypothetical protein